MRRTHCWSRSWAEQLGLLDVFEEFENCTRQQIDSTPADHRELACTNLLLHLAGDHLPEGVEFFKLGPGTVTDAQVMLGLLMTYPPTAKRLTKVWREAICIYNMAMAGAGGISLQRQAVSPRIRPRRQIGRRGTFRSWLCHPEQASWVATQT